MTSRLRRPRPRAAKADAASAAAPFSRSRAQQNPMGMAAALEDLREQGLALATDEAAEEAWVDQVDEAQGQWVDAADQEESAGAAGSGHPVYGPGGGKKGGMSLAFPDVCKLPAPPAPFVPVPYPNTSHSSGGSGYTSKATTSKKSTTTATKEGGGRGKRGAVGQSTFRRPTSLGAPSGRSIKPSQNKIKVG